LENIKGLQTKTLIRYSPSHKRESFRSGVREEVMLEGNKFRTRREEGKGGRKGLCLVERKGTDEKKRERHKRAATRLREKTSVKFLIM